MSLTGAVVAPAVPTAAVAAAASPPPSSVAAMPIVVRDGDAIHMAHVADSGSLSTTKTVLGAKDFSECDVAFTRDGKFFAFADPTHVRVCDAASGDVVQCLSEPKVVQLLFSPRHTFLVSYSHPDPKREDGNLCVFDASSGTPVLRCAQGQWPALQWTSDESYCVRIIAGLVHVHQGNLESKEVVEQCDLQLPKEKSFEVSVAPTGLPLLAVFKPHHKQSQASLRVHRLPNLKDDLLNLNFGRTEGAALQWSPSGNFIALTQKMETDKTGQSYYGTTALAIVAVRERVATPIPLGSGEGIHDIQWSPTADEFIVIHGVMPRNKATLFSVSKATPVPLAVFGEAPRNLIKWAPNGHLFVIGGSGNLAGEFQFYNRDAIGSTTGGKAGQDGKLGSFSEKSSVQCWSPDSRYLLCTTVFSRLRVDNKLVLWKHNGERICEQKFGVLHSASWVPQDASRYPKRAPSPTVAPAEPRPKSGAYRPPVASAAAAALLARPTSSSAQPAKPAGPVGGQVVDPKKKKRR